MILDAMRQAFKAPDRLIPVEALLGDCAGSRMPDVDASRLTPEIARRVVDACPTRALRLAEEDGMVLVLDYAECIACGRCVEAGGGALAAATAFTRCGVARSGLARRFDVQQRSEIKPPEPPPEAVARHIRSMLGRALNIRQVDAGSCNGCEAEIVALTNPYYDLERFGIHSVASPKHADMLLVTGPVTRNMAEALKNTYEAAPSPKLVVAVGACGCSGGIFRESYAVKGPVDEVIPVDGYIPGCPPTPAMLVTGILQVLGRSVARHPQGSAKAETAG